MRRFQHITVVATITMALAIAGAGCAGKNQPLERFVDQQGPKVHEKQTYNQAEFDFWAGVYEPTAEDLQGLRSSWIEHGQAFPESRGFVEVEEAVRKNSQRVVVVALFRTAYDEADLNNRALGWTVHPVPTAIKELPEGDLVLRTLVPVKNPWARYFLLTYTPQAWSNASTLVIGNRTSKVTIEGLQ
jgi:hypothetical protein